MFPYNNHAHDANHFDCCKHVDQTALLNHSINLFNQARWNSALEKLIYIFRSGANTLLDLESIPANMIRARRYGGIRPVSIDVICGTLGRAHDFDSHFFPSDDLIRDRWVSIALARSRNIPLKPVELIQVNGCYFVKDGHHRISVARALGEAAVDAEVTIWDVCCALPWERQPAARIIPLPTA